MRWKCQPILVVYVCLYANGKVKEETLFFESMQRVKKGSSIKNRMYNSSSSSGVGCVILCFIRIRMTLLLCLNRIAKKTNKESYLAVLKRQWRIQFHIQIYGVIALSMNIYINRNVCATIFAGLFSLILIFHLINWCRLQCACFSYNSH